MIFNVAYSKGKPFYSSASPTPGAYVIKHGGRIQYVGYSATNVVKTAYRHFQLWNDRQYRVTFPKKAKIVIFKTKSIKRAMQMERALILKYFPERNIYIPAAPKNDDFYPF